MKNEVKSTLGLLVFLFVGIYGHAQDTLFFEDFEDSLDMQGYQLYDGGANAVPFETVGLDYIQRALPEDLTLSRTVSGFTGQVIGCEDTDGAGFFGLPYIQTDPADIKGKKDLGVGLRVAAPLGNYTAIQYETSDQLIVEYRIDGGIWKQCLYFQGNGSFGEQFFYDAAGDGVTGTDDDVAVTEDSRFFAQAIPDTGSTLEVRVTMAVWGAHEELVFDDISVYSGPVETLDMAETSKPELIWRMYNQHVVLDLSPYAEGCTLNVYTLSGQRVLREENASGLCTLSTRDLDPGIYLLQVSSAEHMETIKFVKR